MNEHVGLIKCPGCAMPWDDGQMMCPYCGGSERPAALRAFGSPLLWAALGGIALLLYAYDASHGGRGLRAVQQWSARAK